MSKRKAIDELTNILAVALRHKIGSIVNKNEIYAARYAKDADILLNEAGKIALNEHWNAHDKEEIKEITKKKLRVELERKDFIDNRKFDLINPEVDFAIRTLNLS